MAKNGFTLIEVLVVSIVLILLAAAAVYFIQPFELIKMRRDVDKLLALTSMHSAITSSGYEATSSADTSLDFCANEAGWEINTTLESKGQIEKMKTDKGNNDKRYEIGTNLYCRK